MKTSAVVAALILVFAASPLCAQGPPPSSGPIVVRGEFNGEDSDWWYGFVDAKRGLLTAHGVDLVSWCAGTPTRYNVWYFQDNLPPADEGLIHELLKADDVVTSVWPISILDNPDFCIPVLEMGVPLAAGTVDMIINDNDVYAWLYDHQRANAYGESAHGLLYTPGGERLILNVSNHCVWNTGNDKLDDPGRHCDTKVLLR